jgi:hypothetical protein
MELKITIAPQVVEGLVKLFSSLILFERLYYLLTTGS